MNPAFGTVAAAFPLTLGHSAVDFWGVTSNERDMAGATAVDPDGFFSFLFERLARFNTL